MAEKNNASNVMVGKFKLGGYAFRAPLGTTLPTDSSTALNSAFVNLGFISSDGLKESRKTDSKNFKDANGTVVKIVQNGSEVTFKVAFIESLNAEVLKTFYGDDAVKVTPKSGKTGTKIAVSAGETDAKAFSYVFEVLESGNAIRIVIPSAVVGDPGDVEYKGEELIQYEVTLTATADDAGKYFYKYSQANDGDAA